jgi:DNA-binding SARP family transcriptional activator
MNVLPVFQMRLLGGFSLIYSGIPITGVNAERLQALLVYLVLHCTTPQLRQQVAIQLWTDATEPEAKASLRRRLHELRQLLPHSDQFLYVNAKTVHWKADAPYELDVAEFKMAIAQAKLAQQMGQTDRARQALEKAVVLYQGDLFPGCYDNWLIAEREQLQQQALHSVDSLITLLSEQGETAAALDHAQQLLRLDPLCETAYCHLMRLYARTGDRASALRIYHQCMTLLREELGINPSPSTCKLYEQILSLDEIDSTTTKHVTVVPAQRFSDVPFVSTSTTLSSTSLPLIGRNSEWTMLQQWLVEGQTQTTSKLMLILGESGIGKTRLLEELAQQVRAAGKYVLWGQGFEAEMLRPYGAWIDAFRSIGAHEFLAEMAALLNDSITTHQTLDRGRLFDATVQFMMQLAAKNTPVLVVLDDIQWIDEASIAFLHYIARLLQPVPVLFACTARKRELADNQAVYKFLQACYRENWVQTQELQPLDREQTAKLAQTIGVTVDGDRVFTDSGGNPLFALEIARALSQAEASYSDNLETLIQGRLFRLDETARDLVPWAAALGRSFNPTTLAQVTDYSLPKLLTAIEQLEQHGIIRPGNLSSGETDYDFVHDIVRQVAYQQLSEPRRRLIHQHIAQALNAFNSANSALINDVAHHATLANDHPLAASASLLAAERCLRLFAYTEAAELAQRGIQHCQHLAPSARLRLHLGLLKVFVKAGVPKHQVAGIQANLQQLIDEASALELNDEAATGLETLIGLNYDQGNLMAVQQHSLHAAEQGRFASPTTTIYMLAHTGSCLAEIGREIPRAEALLLEAQSLANRVGLQSIDIFFGLGCIRRFQGQVAEARQLLQQAWKMAQIDQDHWRECNSLSNLVMLELEFGQAARALNFCKELSHVSAQMGEGSEAPHAAALDAVTRYKLQEPDAEEQLTRSRQILRQIDSPRMLAYIQTLAAEIDLQQGKAKQAIARAEEALEAAQLVKNLSEIGLAWAVLIQAELSLQRSDCAREHLQSLQQKTQDQLLSRRTQTALKTLEALLGQR